MNTPGRRPALQPKWCQSLLKTSSVLSSASSSRTGFDCPGRINSGAISFNGCSTNRRKCARGCGKVSRGVESFSEPNAMRSRSSGLGSFSTTFGRRPNSRSIACNLSSNVSGVSSGRGVNAATAFTNSGESGGQSTGVVCHSEDAMKSDGARERSCPIASRRTTTESPRLEPSATTTRRFASDAGCSEFALTSTPARPACRRCRASASPPTARRGGRRWRRCRGCWPCGSAPRAHRRQRR